MLVALLTACLVGCGETTVYEDHAKLSRVVDYVYQSVDEDTLTAAESMWLVKESGKPLGDGETEYSTALATAMDGELSSSQAIYATWAAISYGTVDQGILDLWNDTTFVIGDYPNIYSYCYYLTTLNMLVDRGYTMELTDELVEAMLPLKDQYDSFGYSTGSDAIDIDTTAVTVSALMPYYSDAEVKAVVDACLMKLATLVNDNGSYTSWGAESICSTAQIVLMQVQADYYGVETGIDVTESIEWLESKILDEGTFDASGDPGFNARQGAEALISYYSFAKDGTTIFTKTISVDE